VYEACEHTCWRSLQMPNGLLGGPFCRQTADNSRLHDDFWLGDNEREASPQSLRNHPHFLSQPACQCSREVALTARETIKYENRQTTSLCRADRVGFLARILKALLDPHFTGLGVKGRREQGDIFFDANITSHIEAGHGALASMRVHTSRHTRQQRPGWFSDV
jgi:hypothetical protein